MEGDRTRKQTFKMQLILENVNGDDEVYLDCLRAICGDTEGKSLLDAMCNLAPHTPRLGFQKKTYVDILERKLVHENEQPLFIQADVLKYLESDTTYDVIISSDGIEHLTKEDGYKLLRLMQQKSSRQVLFTPLGSYMVDEKDTDPEGHHSGWTPDMIEGWACIVLPQYHPTLGIGAWFFWNCAGIEADFKRVKNILKTKSWVKNWPG
jgi:hypothetical protein